MQYNGNVKKYLQLNNKYMRDASECLRKGDYVQASEKLWGATVTIVKVILILTTLCGGTKKTGKTIFAEDLGLGTEASHSRSYNTSHLINISVKS